jgi:glycosyltransferase involved in cell wall biosynthesis
LKKILFLHASAERYGSDRVLLGLLLSLDKDSYYPIVVLPFDGPLVQELIRHNIEYKILKLPVLRRELFNLKGILQYLTRSVVCFFQLTYLVLADQISIIHTNTSAVIIGGFVSCITKRKHVWQIMEIIEKPYLLRCALAKIVGIFSSEVFCISDSVRKHFITFNTEKRIPKFKTLYHGVDPLVYRFSQTYRHTIRQQLGVHEASTVVGYIGRFNAWKGQDVFMEAVKKCIAQEQDVQLHFLIIGSCFQGQDKYRIALEHDLSADSNLKKNVSLYGFQDNIHEWLSAIDILVLPSKLPEPNATIVLAAMATAVPVIGTNIGGTLETIIDKETGLLIPPNNPDSLCENILYLAKNKDLRVTMGRKGLDRVQNVFSLKNYNDTIQKAYE